MKKPLFNEHDKYTDDGNKLDRETSALLFDFMKEKSKEYSVREVSHIISNVVHYLECRIVIDRQFKRPPATPPKRLHPPHGASPEEISDYKASINKV